MNTSFFFKNTTSAEEQKIQEYMESKRKKLEKFVTRLPLDGVHLHVKCEKFDKHNAYDVEMKLQLPSGSLLAREASHAITKAIDLAKDRLEMQLKKSMSTTRRTHRSVKSRESLSRKVAA